MGFWRWLLGLVRPKPKPPRTARVSRRFGVDGANEARLSIIKEIGADASSDNGTRWGIVEPAEGVFANPTPVADAADTCHELGMLFVGTYSPDVSNADPEWGMDTGDGTFADPGTGEPHDRWLRIKPENEADWQESCQFVATEVDFDAVQIGTEPDNQWEESLAGAQGFARASVLAYDAIKAVRPNLLIGCSGWNFANMFLPGSLGAGTQTSLFFDRWLAASEGKFDYLSLHMNHLTTGYAPAIEWVKSRLYAYGYQNKPIWADDMASGPFYAAPPAGQSAPPWSTSAELAIQSGLNAPSDVAAYRILQAQYVIRRPVTAFAAGVERCFLTWDLQKATYFIEIYRYQHFLTTGNVRTPAFYAFQTMVDYLDEWETAEQLATGIFRFTFSAGPPVVVAWDDAGPAYRDMGQYVPGWTVRVTTPVTTLDGSNNPVTVADTFEDVQRIQLTTTPKFLTPVSRPHTSQQTMRLKRRQVRG